MRLIDADALIPTQVHTVVVLKDGREQIESVLYAEQVDDAPTVEPASPWHRVEEPPKKEGRYWCATKFAGHWIFYAAWYWSNVSDYTGVPVGKEEKACGFVFGQDVVYPDYWMPIEPPKEDA